MHFFKFEAFHDRFCDGSHFVVNPACRIHGHLPVNTAPVVRRLSGVVEGSPAVTKGGGECEELLFCCIGRWASGAVGRTLPSSAYYGHANFVSAP